MNCLLIHVFSKSEGAPHVNLPFVDEYGICEKFWVYEVKDKKQEPENLKF